MEEKLKYGAYKRKSSEDKGRQVLSIESQGDWASDTAQRRGISIHKSYAEEKSAKIPFRRPVFDQLVSDIEKGIINALIEWKLDRLARNPEEAGIIMGLLGRGKIKHIIANDREYRPEDNASKVEIEAFLGVFASM